MGQRKALHFWDLLSNQGQQETTQTDLLLRQGTAGAGMGSIFPVIVTIKRTAELKSIVVMMMFYPCCWHVTHLRRSRSCAVRPSDAVNYRTLAHPRSMSAQIHAVRAAVHSQTTSLHQEAYSPSRLRKNGCPTHTTTKACSSLQKQVSTTCSARQGSYQAKGFESFFEHKWLKFTKPIVLGKAVQYEFGLNW